jgi:hypothetical protein
LPAEGGHFLFSGLTPPRRGGRMCSRLAPTGPAEEKIGVVR